LLASGNAELLRRRMNETGPRIRTAVEGDRPELQRIFRAAALSNAGDAPMLLARPEFLVFAGEGVAEGRTLVALAGPPDDDRLAGFATVATGPDGEPDLEDLFVDPDRRRRGVARHLVRRIADAAREAGHRRLWVTGNPHALAFYRAAGFVEVDEVATELGPAPRLSLDLGPG
jgi:GNAT superfamily N-acetyltransferase